jgi:lipoprotein-anchoring transpeptidase ErfK/SrfK
MGSGTTRWRGGITSRWGVAALTLVALVLAGCSGGAQGTPGNNQPGATSTPAPPEVTVSITPGQGEQANPKTPIVVKAAKGTLQAVTVTNTAKHTQVKGDLSADRTTWTSGEALGYATDYQVEADGVDASGKTVHQSGTVHTVKPAAQAFASVIPAPNQTDVGVGQVLVVQFDRDITDKAAAEKALQVTSTPHQDGSWYWISKRIAHYRPKQYWQPGTSITLSTNIYGVNLGNGVYGQSDRSITYKVHDAWIAKADGNSEQMQIFHNGQLVNTMPISMGKDITPTHAGPHVISDKQAHYTMDSCTYGVCQGDPRWYRSDENFAMRISNDGEFVHENPNSVGAQGSSNVSHGCINLNHENAQWFFDHFNLGDVVEVTNSGGPQLPVWDAYGDWELPWDQWQKGSALH